MVAVHPSLFFGHFPAIADEPGAALAGDDFLLENDEGLVLDRQMSFVRSELSVAKSHTRLLAHLMS